MFARSLSLLLFLVSAAFAVPTDQANRDSPTVQLDQGIFVGSYKGTTNNFLGIPYAKAPVGNLRFNLPVPVEPYTGTQTATEYGPACPQQASTFPDLPPLVQDALESLLNILFPPVTSAEDCLSVNVIVPADTNPSAKLPVVVVSSSYGVMDSSWTLPDGDSIVKRSVDLGQPVVFVSMNYRAHCAAYGFLASKEVKEAGVGNIGLQDQRLALRWVQKYISAFGGDPTKVTIWGESAGAISVALQMLTNGGNTEGLFRGAFMQSGSPIPTGDIENGQGDYDKLVAQTGCTGAKDTLQCLREVPFAILQRAVDASPGVTSYQSLRLAWLPRADGKFLADAPQHLVLQGQVANIPFVTGDCDDEGTMFSLSNLNVTSEMALRQYIATNYIPRISQEDMETLLKLYPNDIREGSPFNTGILNALTPQFKRIAAMQGDLVFTAPRRFFLEQRSSEQPTWSFLSTRLKGLPFLGAAHGSDMLNVFGGGDMADYLIYFVNNLDPNGETGIAWPKYTTSEREQLTFQDGLVPLAITKDDYRVDAMEHIIKLSIENPL
ncbi:carotenoid ester lipase precursor [Earliella scabrosa]|nr:carotenoid ester lipase precursor [Earliella scabrosa]